MIRIGGDRMWVDGLQIGDKPIKEVWVGSTCVYKRSRIRGTVADHAYSDGRFSFAVAQGTIEPKIFNADSSFDVVFDISQPDGPDATSGCGFYDTRVYDPQADTPRYFTDFNALFISSRDFRKYLTSLDLSEFHNTPYNTGTSANGLFRGWSALTTLNISGLNNNGVTNMSYMCYQDSKLTTVNLSNIDTSQVTDMRGMFYQCFALASINLDGWDFSSVTNVANMFYNCGALTTILGTFTGIKINLDLKYSPLDNASAVRVISALSTVTSTRTLTLNGNTYNALTSAQKAVATSKGWTLASA